MTNNNCNNSKQQQRKFQSTSSAMHSTNSRYRCGCRNNNNNQFRNVIFFATCIVVANLFGAPANAATTTNTNNIITATSKRTTTGFIGSSFVHGNRKKFYRNNYLINDGITLNAEPPGSENDNDSNIFNEFRNFVDKTFKNFSNNNSNIFGGEEGQGNSSNNSNNGEAGSFTIVKIPVKSIKNGALRLFLMFYLIGMQNTPDQKSWKADQPLMSCNENSSTSFSSPDDDDDDDDDNDDDDGVKEVLDFYYHDRTAMMSIKISEAEIRIDRIGSMPSNMYLMQETVIIGGILNELYECAFDESISPTDRLLQLPSTSTIDRNAITDAIETLAFA